MSPRAIALYLEAAGDGAKLCAELAECAERDVPVVVLQAGTSPQAAAAAQAHTSPVAGDHRVFAALGREAGAVVAEDPAELLELAKRAHTALTTSRGCAPNLLWRRLRYCLGHRRAGWGAFAAAGAANASES